MGKRVLYVVPQGIDLGGIITSSENLMQGFREAGHEATFIHLNHGNARGSPPRGKHADDFVHGQGSGLLMHPVHGWRGSHFSTADPDTFLNFAKAHDVVVWGALYGLRNDKTEGTLDWFRCITDHGTPQVFMVRDDHLEGRVPWAMAFQPYGSFAGVQQCSYDSLEGLGRRALIFSGHGPAVRQPENTRRVNKALACATWKPWKRARTLLASTTGWKGIRLTLAGDGIELRYMRSPDKYRDKDVMPDGKTKIWDAAVMDYLGPIQEEERDRLLSTHKFMIDLSLRQNSGQINRSVIEAMRFGCIPICDPQFLCGVDFDTSLFAPFRNFLPVISTAHPHEVAKEVNAHARLDPEKLAAIRKRNYVLVKQFSRKEAADQLVQFALGKKAGFKYDSGKLDMRKLERGRKAFEILFGEL